MFKKLFKIVREKTDRHDRDFDYIDTDGTYHQRLSTNFWVTWPSYEAYNDFENFRLHLEK